MELAITDDNILEILSNNAIVMVDFWAPWCGPCRMMGPVIDELSIENQDVVIGKMNVDENVGTPSKYGIRGIPTIIIFKGGSEIDRIVGVKSKIYLQAKIDELKASFNF